MSEGAPSTALTRWGWPLGVVWASAMLSAWIATYKIPEGIELGAGRAAALFLSGPALQVLTLVVIRKVLSQRANGRGADLVVLWLVTFLFGLHAAVLATALQMISSLGRAVPVAIALLMVGLGPALAFLEHKSALGIRTPGTLADPEAWRRTHRFAAATFVIAGLLAPLGLLLEGLEALYVSVTPPVLAVIAAILRGMTVRAASSSEEQGGEARPTAEADPESGPPPQLP